MFWICSKCGASYDDQTAPGLATMQYRHDGEMQPAPSVQKAYSDTLADLSPNAREFVEAVHKEDDAVEWQSREDLLKRLAEVEKIYRSMLDISEKGAFITRDPYDYTEALGKALGHG